MHQRPHFKQFWQPADREHIFEQIWMVQWRSSPDLAKSQLHSGSSGWITRSLEIVEIIESLKNGRGIKVFKFVALTFWLYGSSC